MTYDELTSEDESHFEVRVYSKQELALLFFPWASKETATKALRRWIAKCLPLVKALEEIGYDKHRHYFLTIEVKLIVQNLGEP